MLLFFSDVVNYLVCDILPPDMNSNQKKIFFSQVKSFFWEDLCLYKTCGDGIIRRCVPEEEMQSIILHCHDSPYTVMQGLIKLPPKILQTGSFCLTLFKDINHTFELAIGAKELEV